MTQFFKWLKWKLKKCPTISYTGYNCGLWWDTWGCVKSAQDNNDITSEGYYD